MIFWARNSNAMVLVELFSSRAAISPPKALKQVINGIKHTLSLNLVILKGYLDLRLVLGQVGGWFGGWRGPGFGWPAHAPSPDLDNPTKITKFKDNV